MNDPRLWSPLILSRTFQADFRFLVIPNDIALMNEKKNELKNIISKIILAPHSNKTLWGAISDVITSPKEKPKWLLIKDNQHCIVGVISKADDLLTKNFKLRLVKDYLSNESKTAQDITKDIEGRDIYVFTGYVSRVVTAKNDLPYINLNIFSFEKLYEYVCSVWLQNQATANVKNIILSYKLPSKNVFDLNENYYASTSKLLVNSQDNLVAMWPDTEDNRIQLWASSLKYVGNISTCLGIDEKTAVDNNFTNATVTNIKEPKVSINKQLKRNVPRQFADVDMEAYTESTIKESLNEKDSTAIITSETSSSEQFLDNKTSTQTPTNVPNNVQNEHTKLSSNFDFEPRTIEFNSLDGKEVNVNIDVSNNKPSIIIPGILIVGGEMKDSLTININIKIKSKTNPEK